MVNVVQPAVAPPLPHSHKPGRGSGSLSTFKPIPSYLLAGLTAITFVTWGLASIVAWGGASRGECTGSVHLLEITALPPTCLDSVRDWRIYCQ